MTAQAILTIWLLMQLPAGMYRNVKYSNLKGETEMQLIGGQIGVAFKFAGMFACLYFGGFYD